MKHTSPEFYDDIYLAELINSAYNKPKPWWVMPSWMFCIGAAILIGLAWYFE